MLLFFQNIGISKNGATNNIPKLPLNVSHTEKPLYIIFSFHRVHTYWSQHGTPLFQCKYQILYYFSNSKD
jgi:hypothetical protein